jgi:hypothetical protein
MKISTRLAFAALGLGLSGVFTAGTALAGCGFIPPTLTPNAWNPGQQTLPGLSAAVYRSGTAGRFLMVDDKWRHPDPAIVGMWRFVMVTPGANGSKMLVDDGYAQWHSDGTEIQNSGFHAPKTSNFCLGVWKQTGPSTFKLNHFPLGWDATGDNPANPIQLTMTVKLSDANHFTGSFTLKVYVWNGTDLLDASGPPVATVNGTITATRVTIDSTVPGSQ